MATYVVFDVVDIHGRVSPWRMQVTSLTPDTDIVSFVTALAAAAFGSTKPSQGGILNVRYEVDQLIGPISPQADSDIQQNWQMRILDDVPSPFRQGIPGRNDAIALYATGSKVLANLSAATWTALSAALFDGAIGVLNTKTGDTAVSIDAAIASVRGRKRPREGGSR